MKIEIGSNVEAFLSAVGNSLRVISASTCVYNYSNRVYLFQMASRSEAFRAYALICEQRARDETDPVAKREWEQTAIEWHHMANAVSELDDDDDIISIAN